MVLGACGGAGGGAGFFTAFSLCHGMEGGQTWWGALSMTSGCASGGGQSSRRSRITSGSQNVSEATEHQPCLLLTSENSRELALWSPRPLAPNVGVAPRGYPGAHSRVETTLQLRKQLPKLSFTACVGKHSIVLVALRLPTQGAHSTHLSETLSTSDISRKQGLG